MTGKGNGKSVNSMRFLSCFLVFLSSALPLRPTPVLRVIPFKSERPVLRVKGGPWAASRGSETILCFHVETEREGEDNS